MFFYRVILRFITLFFSTEKLHGKGYQASKSKSCGVAAATSARLPYAHGAALCLKQAAEYINLQ